MMQGKPFWHSKTVWVNALAALVLLLPDFIDLPALGGIREELALLLTVANIALRFVTDRPVEVTSRP